MTVTVREHNYEGHVILCCITFLLLMDEKDTLIEFQKSGIEKQVNCKIIFVLIAHCLVKSSYVLEARVGRST